MLIAAKPIQIEPIFLLTLLLALFLSVTLSDSVSLYLLFSLTLSLPKQFYLS